MAKAASHHCNRELDWASAWAAHRRTQEGAEPVLTVNTQSVISLLACGLLLFVPALTECNAREDKTMRRRILALAVCALAAPAALAQTAGPPTENGWYVDRDACPFEGCTYRDWTVEADTVLYDAPWGSKTVGTAAVGDAVYGLTGIVYTRPIPIAVASPAQHAAVAPPGEPVTLDLVPGEMLYLLTYRGEGVFGAWYKGRLLDIEPHRTMLTTLPDIGWGVTSCREPDAKCWWQVPVGKQRYDSVWWAQVMLPNGATGWTRELNNFGNIDALG